MGAVSEP
ncbi:hypothetical protein VULLAG_LOCUS21399 [Vulpes lagopus]